MAVFKNYIIRIPYRGIKLIDLELYFDLRSEEIKKENPYWEEKIFFNKNTIIKRIRHSHREKNIKKIPFGKKIKANLYLFLETNRKNKYIQRIVIEIYICHANPSLKDWEEIRIEKKEGKKCLFKINLPVLGYFNLPAKMYINTY